MIKTCPQCNKPFEGHGNAKGCSPACRALIGQRNHQAWLRSNPERVREHEHNRARVRARRAKPKVSACCVCGEMFEFRNALGTRRQVCFKSECRRSRHRAYNRTFRRRHPRPATLKLCVVCSEPFVARGSQKACPLHFSENKQRTMRALWRTPQYREANRERAWRRRANDPEGCRQYQRALASKKRKRRGALSILRLQQLLNLGGDLI